MKLTDVDSTVSEGVMDYLKDNPWYHVGSAAVGHAPYSSKQTAKDIIARDNFIKNFVKAASAVLLQQAETVRDGLKQQKAMDDAEDEQKVQMQVQMAQQAGQTLTPQDVEKIRQKIKAARALQKSKMSEDAFENQFNILLEQEVPTAQPAYYSNLLKQFLAKYLQSSLGNIQPYQNQFFPYCDQIAELFIKGQPYQGILKELGETIYYALSKTDLAKQTAGMDQLMSGNPQLLELIKQIQKIKRGKDLDEIIKAATEQKKLSY